MCKLTSKIRHFGANVSGYVDASPEYSREAKYKQFKTFENTGPHSLEATKWRNEIYGTKLLDRLRDNRTNIWRSANILFMPFRLIVLQSWVARCALYLAKCERSVSIQ